jgi:hypothetical protein
MRKIIEPVVENLMIFETSFSRPSVRMEVCCDGCVAEEASPFGASGGLGKRYIFRRSMATKLFARELAPTILDSTGVPELTSQVTQPTFTSVRLMLESRESGCHPTFCLVANLGMFRRRFR